VSSWTGGTQPPACVGSPRTLGDPPWLPLLANGCGRGRPLRARRS
jgi:hypothetical protein